MTRVSARLLSIQQQNQLINKIFITFTSTLVYCFNNEILLLKPQTISMRFIMYPSHSSNLVHNILSAMFHRVLMRLTREFSILNFTSVAYSK